MYLLFICCFFVRFCIQGGRVRACSCCASYPLVYCFCLSPEHYNCSVYVGGYYGLIESKLCVFGKLCPVGFLVVLSCNGELLELHTLRLYSAAF